MKNYIKYSLLILFVLSRLGVSAQINTQGNFANILIGQNTFLDASGFEDAAGNVGKGINFPRTNLTKFTFITSLIDSGDVFNSFDGLIVFNSVTGVTVAGQGVVTEVVPGFYFFSNPGNPETITGGQWKLIGDLIKNIPLTPNEVTTSISVEGAKIYATKGQFTVVAYDPNTKLGGATVTIAPPSGISAVYRITVFKGTSTLVFSPTVNSFDFSKIVDNVITGDDMFTKVYPVGTYDYTLEYFK